MRSRRWVLLAVLLSTVVMAVPAAAANFKYARIGDVDGFGFQEGVGLVNYAGFPVNVDGIEVLGPGPPADYLPDLNTNGFVDEFQGDDFDNRNPLEIIGTAVSGQGMVDNGSSGSQFTDLSLSHSFDLTFPTGDFPDPPSNDRNDSHFEFRFFVPTECITPGVPLLLNVAYGDVPPIPADFFFSFASAPSFTVPMVPTVPGTGDGLIQSSSIEIQFYDAFTPTVGGWDGHVDVDIITDPGSPGGDAFYAIDYIELTAPTATGVGPTRTPNGNGALVISPTVFGDHTVFQYDLPDGDQATIEVFDVTGARVKIFPVTGSTGSVAWDGTSLRGNRVASGVYFVRLSTRTWSTTKRAVIMR